MPNYSRGGGRPSNNRARGYNPLNRRDQTFRARGSRGLPNPNRGGRNQAPVAPQIGRRNVPTIREIPFDPFGFFSGLLGAAFRSEAAYRTPSETSSERSESPEYRDLFEQNIEPEDQELEPYETNSEPENPESSETNSETEDRETSDSNTESENQGHLHSLAQQQPVGQIDRRHLDQVLEQVPTYILDVFLFINSVRVYK